MTNETRSASARTDPPAGPSRLTVRFTARDLINVATFAVMYFVIIFAISMLGIISPLAMLLTLPLAAIAAGIPYVLFLTRVRHPGMVALFGIVVGLLYLMIGHPWISTLVTIAVALLGELILRAGKYRSEWAAIWTSTAFSLWFIGPWIPLFVNREEYLRSAGMESMGDDYVAAFDQVVTVPTLLGMLAAMLVCGFLGALLGTRLLRKHFRKAGLA